MSSITSPAILPAVADGETGCLVTPARSRVTGVVIVVVLEYAAGRGMTALLFGVAPGDPAVYLAAVALALFMTIAGSVRPAFSAARVDPVITMQTE